MGGLVVALLLLLTSTKSLLIEGAGLGENRGRRQCWPTSRCPFARKQFVGRRDSCSHPRHWHDWATPRRSQGNKRIDGWIDRTGTSGEEILHPRTNRCCASERLSDWNRSRGTVIGNSPALLPDTNLCYWKRMLTGLILVLFWNGFSVWVTGAAHHQ